MIKANILLVAALATVSSFAARQCSPKESSGVAPKANIETGDGALNEYFSKIDVFGVRGDLGEVERLHAHWKLSGDRLSVAGGYDGERAAGRVFRAGELAADVVGDARDVLHHPVGTREYAVVDALQHVRNAGAADRKIDLERIVDVAGTVAADRDDVAVDLEKRDYLAKLFFSEVSAAHIGFLGILFKRIIPHMRRNTASAASPFQ